MNGVALIILITIVALTSYICGFVMGYGFNEKEAQDGYFRDSRDGKEAGGNRDAAKSGREDC